jgi:hypothetical protein
MLQETPAVPAPPEGTRRPPQPKPEITLDVTPQEAYLLAMKVRHIASRSGLI